MILRTIEQKPALTRGKPRPIWDVLFEHQSKMNGASECWLITQPAHSALSGEIAAKLQSGVFGAFDEATVRAIALHDAGWSQSDSEQVRDSRSHPIAATRKDAPKTTGHNSRGKDKAPFSFLGVSFTEAARAWTGSVETALKASLLGGFLVSEHFRSIAQFQVDENGAKAQAMAKFARQEKARQGQLRPKIRLDNDVLERMVEGLRFCDLLSLYLCMGIAEPVELPEHIQQHTMVLEPAGEAGTYRLRPFPFPGDEVFSFQALRHPRTKTVSSATFQVKITG